MAPSLSSKSSKNVSNGTNISPLLKLYIYGLHGYFIEVMFTAVWEFVVSVNWKLPGCTSVWSLFIYAICGYGIEQLHLKLNDKIPFYIRGLIYVLFTYSWEFLTGSILSYFDACPWDYTLFDYHIRGLITLEYAPLWYIATLLQEHFLTKSILQLQWRQARPSSNNNNNKQSMNEGLNAAGPPQYNILKSTSTTTTRRRI